MPNRSPILFAITVAVFPLAADGAHDLVECPDDGISVRANTDDQQGLLCELAQEAVSAMSSCNLPQRRPINIEVVDAIDHPFATCLAAYDCDYDRIRIVLRQSYDQLLEPDDPYASFPPEVLVRTLLFHEISHALIEQNTSEHEVSLVDHEYIAAAMELAHMEATWRETILGYAALEAPAEGRINIWIYRLDPRRFAANVWLHFVMPQNGCNLVGRLVSGETTFEDQ